MGVRLGYDERHRMHTEIGKGAGFAEDGKGPQIWFWHGVRVTRQVIERPETLTVEQIQSEQNAEVRRVMIERLGPERYLQGAGSELLHEDEFGKLWRAENRLEREPMLAVEVVNSTAEPDGSYKDYFLRVPPSCVTAREAVAWTFDIPEHQYVLAAQS